MPSKPLQSGPKKPPPAPTQLVAKSTEPGVVDLTWQGQGGSTFVVERMTDGAWKWLGDTTSLTFADSTGQPGRSYSYRVKAFNRYGSSMYSNTAVATVMVPPPPSRFSFAKGLGNWGTTYLTRVADPVTPL